VVVNGEGEPVMTTTVHLSEVADVLEDAAGIGFAVVSPDVNKD
jgi:S1-C subfamily serine protease